MWQRFLPYHVHVVHRRYSPLNARCFIARHRLLHKTAAEWMTANCFMARHCNLHKTGREKPQAVYSTPLVIAQNYRRITTSCLWHATDNCTNLEKNNYKLLHSTPLVIAQNWRKTTIYKLFYSTPLLIDCTKLQ